MKPFIVARHLDQDTVLDLILESLAELVDYELAVVLGIDSLGGLRVRKARGPLYRHQLENFYINLDTRQDLRAIMNGDKPYLFDTESAHLDTYHDILDLPEGHSCLVAPLQVQGQSLGLLTFDHRVCGKFTPGIVRFVGSMARLVAMVLTQTDLSNSLEKSNQVLMEERNRLLSIQSKGLKGLIGNSKPWLTVLEQLQLASVSDIPVLLRGETGTGKEGLAQALHQLSPRRSGPFVALNCSAISESMAESELFGHEKGSFTGALTSRRGRFELAHGGTLFLDEIGDLPLALQAKLLRVIQEASLERLGSEKTIQVDVRIIAASHINFEDAISRGTFRQDLFYRLNVFPLVLPPLRERREDIAILSRHFIEKIRQRSGSKTIQYPEPCSAQVLDWLENQPWPGNIRELENTLERAMVLSGGRPLELEHLPLGQKHPSACMDTDSTDPIPGSLPSWEEGTRALIRSALEQSGGKIYGPGGAAEILALKPSTLQSKMEKLGLFNQP